MNDRDEVIRELQTEIENAIYPDRPRRFMFPLWLAEKVLELLKAQEPRVISWQDAESMRLCWIETRCPHTINPADLIYYFDESPTITVFKIHQNAIDWPLDEYGIKWRCWDNEPTNEQMKEAKWE